jgi:hypothetical protein
MKTQKYTLAIVAILAAIVSLSAAVGINSVTAQNMTGNETGGNMTAATNMTNATAGGNMTDTGNMTVTSPTPIQ